MRPVVGMSINDSDIECAVYYTIRDSGITPLRFDHTDSERWELLIKATGRKRIVCIVDDDPEMIMRATALGIDGVIYDRPWNRFFVWHLRATGIEDLRRGLAYQLKKWEGRV